MAKILSILLILTHMLWCLPEAVYEDNDFSEKKTEKEAFQDVEDEKEGSAIPLKNIFSSKTILKFYFLEDYKNIQSYISPTEAIFIKEPFYIKYSSLRI